MDSFYSTCGHPLPLNFNPADHYIEALSGFPVVGDSDDGTDDKRANGKSKEEMWRANASKSGNLVTKVTLHFRSLQQTNEQVCTSQCVN